MSFVLVKSHANPPPSRAPLASLRDLRRLIPAEILTRALATAAMCGVMPRLDPKTGQEVEVADPVSIPDRIALSKYLLDKRLPAAKSEEVQDEATVDLTSIPLSPEEIKRLPLNELQRVIEAQFTVQQPDDATPDTVPPQDSQPMDAGDDHLHA